MLPLLGAGAAGTGTRMLRGAFAVVVVFVDGFVPAAPPDGATGVADPAAGVPAGGSPAMGAVGATSGWGSSGRVRASAKE